MPDEKEIKDFLDEVAGEHDSEWWARESEQTKDSPDLNESWISHICLKAAQLREKRYPEEEKARQELIEAVDSNKRTCDSTTDEEWVRDYKPYRCYFYPGRDCLGWRAGSVCGRLNFLKVPDDETGQPEEGPWIGMSRRRD